MATEIYRRQVALLLDVLPEVAKETSFALHGGTAINLFIRNMPRLSVDIDLTYLPIENRKTSLQNISEGLSRINESISSILPNVRISLVEETSKLLISHQGAQIKLEVNQTNRGVLYEPHKFPLCGKAQEEFEVFCEVPIVGEGQLYGGKICAALDRQHPRDLFDVKYFLENTEFTDDHKEGLLLAFLSSNRPIEELLFPNLIDQSAALANQFEGMTNEPFTYEDFEKARDILIKTIHEALTDEDREFLLSVQSLQPDWSIYDFERFPSVQWKLQNLQALKGNNKSKFDSILKSLEEKLGV